jgi:hypothetical protein
LFRRSEVFLVAASSVVRRCRVAKKAAGRSGLGRGRGQSPHPLYVVIASDDDAARHASARETQLVYYRDAETAPIPYRGADSGVAETGG